MDATTPKVHLRGDLAKPPARAFARDLLLGVVGAALHRRCGLVRLDVVEHGTLHRIDR